MLESIEFFESNTKLPDMLDSLWKVQEFYSSKKSYCQWATWWSKDQESNAYATVLAWHVIAIGSLNWPFVVNSQLHFFDLVDSHTSSENTTVKI